jgi:hypothetical protein
MPATLGLPDETSICYTAARDTDAELEISSINKELWVAGKAIDSVDKISLTGQSAYESGTSS